MPKLFSLVAFLLLTTFATAQKGQALPDISMKTLDGQTVNLRDYVQNDKPTIISFWATWCAPCKNELDVIADLYEDWQADYGAKLVAVTIDTRRQLANVKPMVVTKGWTYEVLSDANGAAQQALSFETIPQTFVVDKDGNIIYSHNGYRAGDEEELEAILREASEK